MSISALRELHKFLVSEKCRSVAYHAWLQAVGGLSWDEVYPLIQQH
ncbi:MAG: Appr-1-p processing protein, partial [Moraxellaceae bacterium]|nr:Appr-1-p processing protein [Moraxellaceae bacterium]